MHWFHSFRRRDIFQLKGKYVVIKILFVCHGNICRSPMAEFMMKKIVEERGISDKFEIASAAVSREEIGNSVYPPARRLLEAHGMDCRGKFARQMTIKDYGYYDYLICMDNSNLHRMRQICGGDPENKMALLMNFTAQGGEVADPWYSGDFGATWRDISLGLESFLKKLDIDNL